MRRKDNHLLWIYKPFYEFNLLAMVGLAWQKGWLGYDGLETGFVYVFATGFDAFGAEGGTFGAVEAVVG